MADNYQFDKNSKLFQKFMAMKANKVSQSVVEKQPDREITSTSLQKNRSVTYHFKEKYPKKDRGTSKETNNHSQSGLLHVTIDDIEEAASVALNESTMHLNEVPMPEENTEYFEHKSIPKDMVKDKVVDKNNYEEVNDSQVVKEAPKIEKNRERRTRQFRQRPKVKEENQEQNRNIRNSEPITSTNRGSFDLSFKPAQVNLNRQIENVEPNITQEELAPKLQEINFTLGSKEGEYRKKYQKLNQRYEQLKQTYQQERKHTQLLLNDKESQIQILKEKYFELRSTEDTLTTDLKRYKQKLQGENMMRTKFEEEVKELNFRIIELEEILEGKETQLRKKNDEVNHWKTQSQMARSQVKEWEAEVQSLRQRCKFLEAQSKIDQKDVSHKGLLVDELRKNIATLIEQNNIAKDQIYKLTIRLYHMEQENMSLKADVLRRQKQQPHNVSIIQDSYMRSIEALSPKKTRERVERNQHVPEPDNTREAGQRRRRQFARERAVTKQETGQVEPRRERRANQTQRLQPTIDNNARQIASRIQFLQNQIEARNKQKAMNGRMRKQKIELQRQLQMLLQKQQL